MVIAGAVRLQVVLDGVRSPVTRSMPSYLRVHLSVDLIRAPVDGVNGACVNTAFGVVWMVNNCCCTGERAIDEEKLMKNKEGRHTAGREGRDGSRQKLLLEKLTLTSKKHRHRIPTG